MAINLGDGVTVHINRIEVQSDDPERFAFGLVESAEALKRVADERMAERRARDQAAVAASTTPCQSYGCTGRMVRVEGTVGYGCSKCSAWESALTAESRGQGTATRVSAASLPTHWERKPDSAHIAEAMKPLMEAEIIRMNARSMAISIQGETDAPGTPRPADCTCSSFTRCEPCAIAKALTDGKPFAPPVVVPNPVDPLDVEYDGRKLRDLLYWDARNQQETPMRHGRLMHTPAQRAAVSAHWSAQLRAKVDAAKQAERNVVTYCELDPDD